MGPPSRQAGAGGPDGHGTTARLTVGVAWPSSASEFGTRMAAAKRLEPQRAAIRIAAEGATAQAAEAAVNRAKPAMNIRLAPIRFAERARRQNESGKTRWCRRLPPL